MNKPAMIRAVQPPTARRTWRAEQLRSELLQCAADIVELATVAEYEPRFSLRTGGIRFLPVGAGCGICRRRLEMLCHETELMHDVYDFDEGPSRRAHI